MGQENKRFDIKPGRGAAMEETGIVRRIDDLGRVVIAKTLRQRLQITEGEPLEFFIDGDKIILRKYRVDEGDETKQLRSLK